MEPISYAKAVDEIKILSAEQSQLQSDLSEDSRTKINLQNEFTELHNVYHRTIHEKLLLTKMEALFGKNIYADSDLNPATKVINKLFDLANDKTNGTPDETIIKFLKGICHNK